VHVLRGTFNLNYKYTLYILGKRKRKRKRGGRPPL